MLCLKTAQSRLQDKTYKCWKELNVFTWIYEHPGAYCIGSFLEFWYTWSIYRKKITVN